MSPVQFAGVAMPMASTLMVIRIASPAVTGTPAQTIQSPAPTAVVASWN
jgi:hypothetical protein